MTSSGAELTRPALLITPSNLPEDRLYTHTNLVWDAYRRLRGNAGPIDRYRRHAALRDFL